MKQFSIPSQTFLGASGQTAGNCLLTTRILSAQNERFKGTGGISEENRANGFVPAFLDTSTGAVHLSRYADGRLAPVHLLDGLPAGLIVRRTSTHRALSVDPCVITGFVRRNRFYTREQAAQAVMPE